MVHDLLVAQVTELDSKLGPRSRRYVAKTGRQYVLRDMQGIAKCVGETAIGLGEEWIS
jgi:hypothetical protein